ncbi:major glycerophosphoinositol permease Git3p [[Candida] anglica]|uniref:Major glycerophosphoinositol permease Git3p n=1 Tax=[Candida] anglica TaxID=148631 RepID=A0ABP0E9B6_9ASCO
MSTRDLPKSIPDFFIGWTKHLPNEITFGKSAEQLEAEAREQNQNEHFVNEEIVTKTKMSSLWPAFASGAGLFSDGYVNNSIGTVSFALKKLYPTEMAANNSLSNVSSIAFAGTVLGMLTFGYVSDRISRKWGMLFTNAMLILFTILTAAATWGANGSIYGLLAAITAFRFLLGVAIGAEYPTASVISAEFANQLPAGNRNRYFVWFTNTMIDLGFVVSAFVPLVLLWIFSEKHYTAIWRLTLGLGAIPPISLFFMRMKIAEGESFKKMNFNNKENKASVPYLLILKFYWFRLAVVSIIWFIYDFSAYSFGIYSSFILENVVPDGSVYKTWGWNVVFNLFYMPGAILGALAADYIGPRLTLAIGVGLQGVVGFAMAGSYDSLSKHLGGFVVVYGIFTTLGEFGPGDNIGLLASKTSATPIRGQYYGIAAAFGKIGAFVGTWVFPHILDKYGNQGAYYISSALCLFSAALALFFCPSVGQDALNKEDGDFIRYLEASGYDISKLGNGEITHDIESESYDGSSNKKTHEVIVNTEDKASL